MSKQLDDDGRWQERLKRVTKAKDVPVPKPKSPLRSKPGPANKEGDNTPNPLPDDAAKNGGGGKGGDPGRS